ncbi:hypothetical protein COK00_11385 [Bacillus cereus]|uniref:hypothetical protein n=1 Tax=Bacillus cereus TaxID=1396 RepID=UPI000BFA1BC8|nr:hypothetical protein [Bacillus cereus]PFP65216.1 hypothetical protein COK00_11385 [Bacillus cereus]
MSEQVKEEKNIKTYATFSGSDVITVLNGHVISETYEIKYTERFGFVSDGLEPVIGTIKTMLFDKSPIEPYMLTRSGSNEFILFIMNEYGQKLSIRFEGFRFTKREGCFDVDELVLGEEFHFTCNKLVFDNQTPFGPLEEHDFKFGYTKKAGESV